MLYKQRIDKQFSRFGEAFSINGTTPAKGFFQQLDTGRMHIYLDDTEVAMMIRPGLFLVVPADTVIAAGNTIARDGRTYTVLKTANQRIKDTVMVKIAILG
jgi:hypothetical protein